MKIRVLSDLHLEFGDYFVEAMPDDKKTVLVLAGDITVSSSLVSVKIFGPFLQRCVAQFHHIVMVMGNHEHYHGDIATSKNKLQKVIDDFHLTYNVTILEDEVICFPEEEIVFIGATLWTDCSLDGVTTAERASVLWHGMTDSKIVKYRENKMSIWNSIDIFNESKKYILNNISYFKEDLGYKTVVVTHHCPSNKSTHSMYKGQDFNMFFTSHMDLGIIEANPDIWIHGHTHHAFDYRLDEALCNTRVICNPRGYFEMESLPEIRGFNPTLTIEL